MDSLPPTVISVHGRHDACIALRAVPVIEAVAAIAIYDML
ncbi:MAG: chorismate synthase [Clostridia bacterium]|nr:chorismate synthase [Clostridia bacterium]